MEYALNKPLVAVVGSKHSGKTSAIEVLIKGLSKRGYKVATAKHIHEANFTIDREGTDTWRHARAGADVVVSVSTGELAVIKKVRTADLDLTRIVSECGDDVDVVILEGFREMVGKDRRVQKIVAIKSVEEIHEASERFSSILAYTGLIAGTDIPRSFNYIDLREENGKLVGLVYDKVEVLKKGLRPHGGTRITIDGKSVPCKGFVQEFVRKTVLGMISTLRGADIKGDEEVHILIKSEST